MDGFFTMAPYSDIWINPGMSVSIAAASAKGVVLDAKAQGVFFTVGRQYPSVFERDAHLSLKGLTFKNALSVRESSQQILLTHSQEYPLLPTQPFYDSEHGAVVSLQDSSMELISCTFENNTVVSSRYVLMGKI
jgi:hypothetical protein